MSFEEKGTWLSGAIVVALNVLYGLIVYARLPDTPVEEIAYQVPLILVIAATAIVTIAGYIIMAVVSPDANRADQRDRDINRVGQYVGGTVLGYGMLMPLGLTMAGAPHFWIASAMHIGFVVSALVTTAVKLVLYRRGF